MLYRNRSTPLYDRLLFTLIKCVIGIFNSWNRTENIKICLFLDRKKQKAKQGDRMLTIQIQYKMTKTKLKTLGVPICYFWDYWCFKTIDWIMIYSSSWLIVPDWPLSSSHSRGRHLFFSGFQMLSLLNEHQGTRSLMWTQIYTAMAQNQTSFLGFGLKAKFNIEVLIKAKPPCFKRFIH